MTDHPRHPDANDHAGASRERGRSSAGTYVIVVVVIALVLGLVVLHVAGVVGPGAR